MFWIPGHSGVRGNKVADGLARGDTVNQFVGTELALDVSGHIAKRKIKHWMVPSIWRCGEVFPVLRDSLGKWLRCSRGSVLAFDTQVRGFTPGRSLRIFRAKKILSTPSFGGEVKPSVGPMS